MQRFTGDPHTYGIVPNEVRVPSRWQFIRIMGKNVLSAKAQLKLEWIIFYHTIGGRNAQRTASHFGIARKTLYKYLNRFHDHNLRTLEEHSRAPIATRQRDITPLVRKRIKTLRTTHMKWGKMKLKRRYLLVHKEHVSSWKIQKVIEEERLYGNHAVHKKEARRRRQARRRKKRRITELVKKEKINHLWHVDTVIFTLTEGGYRYLLTAIDEFSKVAYGRLYTTHSSRKAADFLKRLHFLTEGEMINLHHDNGSEFEKDFRRACEQLLIPQWYSRVRTPGDNAVLERFNRTIQEEFVEISDIGVEDTEEFNHVLLDWLIEYNSIRPHQALDYLSPLEYIDAIQNLPMSSSSTRS